MVRSNQKRKNSLRREKILQVLRSSKEHPTADWIYEQLKQEFPNLSLGTVYRNLKILEEEGEIQSIHGGSTYDRYDADLESHHHVICEHCGCVMDIETEIDQDLFDTAEKQTGFKIKPSQITLYGLCPKCRKLKFYDKE